MGSNGNLMVLEYGKRGRESSQEQRRRKEKVGYVEEEERKMRGLDPS